MPDRPAARRTRPGTRSKRPRVCDGLVAALLAGLLCHAGLAFAQAAAADIVLTAPDGRRVLLKSDGTWRYQAPEPGAETTAAAIPQAALQLSAALERGNGCRLVMNLANRLPYEIVHIVPYFSAHRANGVSYDVVSVAFQSIRPGDRQERVADFTGIPCREIARVQVIRGDRCEMGDLGRFSDLKGACLARVQVLPSELVRFEK